MPEQITEESLNMYLSGRLVDYKLPSSLGLFKESAPRIFCTDGASLSVQTGKYLYCTPRDNTGPWYDVEVGFPSIDPPETWAKYCDNNWDTGDKQKTVYGYIPTGLVVDFINKHGGSDLADDKS